MNTIQPVHQANRRRYASADGRWGLTASEWRVVETICAGQDSQQLIAQHLCVSERTVQTHLYKIFNKLDVRSKTLLVLKVLDDDAARKRCFPHLRIFGGKPND